MERAARGCCGERAQRQRARAVAALSVLARCRSRHRPTLHPPPATRVLAATRRLPPCRLPHPTALATSLLVAITVLRCAPLPPRPPPPRPARAGPCSVLETRLAFAGQIVHAPRRRPATVSSTSSMELQPMSPLLRQFQQTPIMSSMPSSDRTSQLLHPLPSSGEMSLCLGGGNTTERMGSGVAAPRSSYAGG